jgi:hypothetical protein
MAMAVDRPRSIALGHTGKASAIGAREPMAQVGLLTIVVINQPYDSV